MLCGSVLSDRSCGDGLLAVKESPVNRKVSEVWGRYLGVFLWVIGVKYVFGYYVRVGK